MNLSREQLLRNPQTRRWYDHLQQRHKDIPNEYPADVGERYLNVVREQLLPNESTAKMSESGLPFYSELVLSGMPTGKILTKAEIVDALTGKCCVNTVGNYLNKLAKDGYVEKLGYNKFTKYRRLR